MIMDECKMESWIFEFLVHLGIPVKHMGETLRQNDFEKLAGN